MADDRTIDENAETEVDSGPVAQPNFTLPLGPPSDLTQPRPGGAILVTRRSIGRFRVDAELGSGGMADVFRAYDPMLDREVALKVLHAKLSSSDKEARGIERVLREARAAAALSHPNIVTIYEVGEADGEVFIAMELLHGKVLREVVADGAISLEQKLLWLLQSARALTAAHTRGLVHRDVKPENMFVCTDGTLKLLDFGIAKRDNDTGDSGEGSFITGPSSLRTEAGRRLGTPRYMAPEQHAGRGTDARTDEYAWGLVAFELLCGSLVVGEHATATAEGEVEPTGASSAMRIAELRTKVPALPAELGDAIARATEPKPSARFASMAPIVDALERHTVRRVPVVAGARVAGGFPSTTKWLVAGAIIVGAIAVLLGTSLRRAVLGLSGSSKEAKIANNATPLCRVVRTRTASRPPRDIVIARDDGALVTVHQAGGTLTIEAEPADGSAARPLLPFALGGPDHEEQVVGAEVAALGVRGDPDVFLAVSVEEDHRSPSAASVMLLGPLAPRGGRHLRGSPSGFAAVAFGEATVVVITTMAPHLDLKGVTLFKLGSPGAVLVIEGGSSARPAMATSRGRLAIAYQNDQQVHFVFYTENLERLGDVLTVRENTQAGPAVAFADEGATAVVYFTESVGGKQRLLMSTLPIGDPSFRPAVAAIDEPLLDEPPFVVPVAGGSVVGWITTNGGAFTVRVSPIGSGGTLIGPSTVVSAPAINQLHATAAAKGLSLAWNDGTGTTTIADVECQMPAVKTPAR